MQKRFSSSVKVFYPRFSREEVLDRLHHGLTSLRERLPVIEATLFGSYASGRFNAASDIDLLVIYQGPATPGAFQLVRQCLDLPGLEPHVYSEEEAAHLAPTIHRMKQNGVPVYPAPVRPGQRKPEA